MTGFNRPNVDEGPVGYTGTAEEAPDILLGPPVTRPLGQTHAHGRRVLPEVALWGSAYAAFCAVLAGFIGYRLSPLAALVAVELTFFRLLHFTDRRDPRLYGVKELTAMALAVLLVAYGFASGAFAALPDLFGSLRGLGRPGQDDDAWLRVLLRAPLFWALLGAGAFVVLSRAVPNVLKKHPRAYVYDPRGPRTLPQPGEWVASALAFALPWLLPRPTTAPDLLLTVAAAFSVATRLVYFAGVEAADFAAAGSTDHRDLFAWFNPANPQRFFLFVSSLGAAATRLAIPFGAAALAYLIARHNRFTVAAALAAFVVAIATSRGSTRAALFALRAWAGYNPRSLGRDGMYQFSRGFRPVAARHGLLLAAVTALATAALHAAWYSGGPSPFVDRAASLTGVLMAGGAVVFVPNLVPRFLFASIFGGWLDDLCAHLDREGIDQ